MIYLDYSANTPADPAVLERFVNTEQTFHGNPNSNHPAGLAAREELARVTDRIAARLGVAPAELIYTSGASEANNTAIKGIARASRHVGKHIISTPLEHASVSGCLTALQEQGYEIDLLDVKRDGTIDLEQLRELLRKDTILVALTAVDSELGTVQPVAQAAELLADWPDCRLHVDATQALGKTALHFDGVDTMSLALHKIYGLNGSGILFKRRSTPMEPLIHGGVSNSIYRSGTPTLGLAAAAEAAIAPALNQQPERAAIVARHNARLRQALAAYPKVRINSPKNAVPHILNLSVQGVRGETFQQTLAAEGVCVSVKSACSAAGMPSRAVLAVSGDRRNALSSWRISLSHLTTDEELSAFLAIFDRCYHQLTEGKA